MHQPIVNDLEESLKKAFPNAVIEVHEDSSVLDGAAAVIRVVDAGFAGVSKVQRHQRIYQQLGSHITSGRLHALKIIALTPTETAP